MLIFVHRNNIASEILTVLWDLGHVEVSKNIIPWKKKII